MARLDSIIKRIDKVLTKTKPFVGTAYKREFVKAGGDPVTGRNATVSVTDKVFTVPPAIRDVTTDDAMRIVGTAINPVTDFIITASPTVLTESDLANPNLSIVLKKGNYEEEFSIVSFYPARLYGGVVCVEALIRSKKRAVSS
jgi:hypothetical protein